MNKRLLLATGTFLAPAAVAGPYGCNAWPSQGSHAIASYCPYSAPYGEHQGIGRLWFNSGYSKSGERTRLSPLSHRLSKTVFRRDLL